MGVAKAITGMVGGVLGMQSGNKEKGFAERGLAESDPFAPYRHQYGNQLEALMKNPSSVKNTPGYAFELQQGTTALDRSLAAKGYLGSGNEAAALTKFGQDYASSKWQEQVSMLSNLAGVSMQPQLDAAVKGYDAGVQTYGQGVSEFGSGLGSLFGG